MPHKEMISFRDAVTAYGPCSGGYEHARRRLIGRLEADEQFHRELIDEAANWASRFTQGQVPASTEWFQLLQNLDDSFVPGDDEDFDEFREHMLRRLCSSDDLILDRDQVRSIWFPTDFGIFAPDAKLAGSWSFMQALAWVATKDFGVVGFIDQLDAAYQIGWLACLAAERCCECTLTENMPRWQQCRCLTNALDKLCEWPPVDMPLDRVRLGISASEGWLKPVGDLPPIRLAQSDFLVAFPAIAKGANPAFKPKGNGGAPVIIAEAKAMYLERMTSGKRHKSASQEAEIIRSKLLKMHNGDENQVPAKETIRRRIREWDRSKSPSKSQVPVYPS